MREIKFRAWTGREMVYDNQDKIVKPKHLNGYADKHFSKPRVYHDTIQVWFYETTLPYSGEEHFDHPTNINPHSVMQYTGLRDRNKKEVYEGDIISWWFATEQQKQVRPKTVVEWDSVELRFVSIGTQKMLHALRDIEVIGNIYENPELLN